MSINQVYEEKEILQRLAEGDQAAFNQLVEHHYQHIYQVALGYIKIVQAAEDTAQEIFFRLWKNRQKLLHIDSLKDYLFILTRNAVLDAMRKKGARFPVGDYLEQTISSSAYSPEEAMSYKEFNAAVQKIVDLLPPQQKTAFRLSREMGLSHDEIAAQMALSKNTVKNHIVAALNFIRHQLSLRDKIMVWWLMLVFAVL